MNKTFISSDDLKEMEQRKRATLINSIGGFKFVSLIGTADATNKTNLAIFSSLFHLGANPALVGFVVRPDSVDRHTLSNILETNVYTINHINETIYKKAHQTAARYEKEISEFEATGLTMDFELTISRFHFAQTRTIGGIKFLYWKVIIFKIRS